MTSIPAANSDYLSEIDRIYWANYPIKTKCALLDRIERKSMQKSITEACDIMIKLNATRARLLADLGK